MLARFGGGAGSAAPKPPPRPPRPPPPPPPGASAGAISSICLSSPSLAADCGRALTLIKCGPKPGRGTVEPPKRYQKPHGNNRDALQRPKRYPRATQGLPKGCTRDQHRGNTVPVRCIQDTRKRMGMGRVACCVAAILIMAKTLGEQAVSAPSSH